MSDVMTDDSDDGIFERLEEFIRLSRKFKAEMSKHATKDVTFLTHIKNTYKKRIRARRIANKRKAS